MRTRGLSNAPRRALFRLFREGRLYRAGTGFFGRRGEPRAELVTAITAAQLHRLALARLVKMGHYESVVALVITAAGRDTARRLLGEASP